MSAAAMRAQTCALVFAAVAAWATTHNYLGVFHDGVLYAFQAMARGGDPVLMNDLFLRFGSQDDYTVFPWLHHQVISALGLSSATMLIVAVGQALWLGAAYLALRAIFRTTTSALLALTLLAAADPRYGAAGVLRFGEGIATPRVYAEALCLFALAAVLRDRLAAAGALTLAAMAAHPLVALSGGGLVFLVAAFRDRRLLILLPAGVAAALAAAALDVGPAGSLFERFDDEWLAAVRLRASYLFLETFYALDWARLGMEALTLAVAFAMAGAAHRALYGAALAAMALGVGLTYLGADTLENVLLTQLQPWRLLWITKVVALFALAALAMGAYGRARAARFIALLLALTTAASGFSAVADLTLFALAVALAIAAAARGRARVLSGVVVAAALIAFAANGVIVLDTLAGLAAFYGRLGEEAGYVDWRFDLIGPAAAILALIVYRMRAAAPAIAAAVLLLGVAVTSLAVWDRRDAWRTYVERNAGALPSPVTFERPEAPIYWRGRDLLPAIWFGYGRSSFASRGQGAGSAFNRETALAFQERETFIKSFDEDASENVSIFRGRAPREPELGELQAICRHGDAPEVVVLRGPIDGVPHAVWTSPVPVISVFRDPELGRGMRAFDVRRVTEHYFFRCADILSAPAE